MPGRQRPKAARQPSTDALTSVNLRGAVIIQPLILHCLLVSKSLAGEVHWQWRFYLHRVCSSSEVTG